MREAVIVDCLRTAVGKSPRGALRYSRPDDLAALVIRALLDRYPAAKEDVEDVILGCAMPEGEAGSNMARQSSLRAGLPDAVPAMTINRFCSSGLQAIALAAERIRVLSRPTDQPRSDFFAGARTQLDIFVESHSIGRHPCLEPVPRGGPHVGPSGPSGTGSFIVVAVK